MTDEDKNAYSKSHIHLNLLLNNIFIIEHYSLADNVLQCLIYMRLGPDWRRPVAEPSAFITLWLCIKNKYFCKAFP